jgi:hypothetical protein
LPRLARGADGLDDIREVARHLGGVETNHTVAALFEPRGAGGVVGRLVGGRMRIAVDFDGELGLSAVEVEDEATDRVLSADLETDLAIADRLPNLRFRRRQRMAEVAGALEDGGVRVM